MNIFSLAFVRYAGERAAKTVAQVVVALLVGGQTGIIGIDWKNVASVAALAAIVSVLTSVTSQTGTPAVPAGDDHASAQEAVPAEESAPSA